MEDQRRRVMDRAWKLQEERDKAADRQHRLAEEGRAAAELGLDPELVREAEAALRREDGARAQRRLVVGAGVGAVLFLGLGMIFFLRPAPSFHDDFAQASNRWVLDKNSGTEAGVDFVDEKDRSSVAVVRVERFQTAADGTFQVNLDRTGAVDASGLTEAVVDIRGEGLPITRLYLEAGDERWRSPPINVTAQWMTHRLPLASFDHQVREGGKWQTTGHAAPGEVDTMSLKLGHYMNEATAHGEVRFDDLRLE